MSKSKSPTFIDQPVPYAVVDMPVPYRVRVAATSSALRTFVVPMLSVRGSSESPPVVEERPSETRRRPFRG